MGVAWEQRTACLQPLLPREAQIAAQQLPPANRLDYKQLTQAILQRVGRTLEQHRQCFRTLTLEEVGRPFVFLQQLRDAGR